MEIKVSDRHILMEMDFHLDITFFYAADRVSVDKLKEIVNEHLTKDITEKLVEQGKQDGLQ